MARVLSRDLPFDLASDASDDGLHADTRDDESIASVYLQRGGRVVAAVRFDIDASGGESIERHESVDDEGDEGEAPDGLPAWVTTALLDLARRAAGLHACAFCDKTSTEVAKLIMGPRQGICNECVALCNDILAAG